MADEEATQLKAGHPPAVKAGGMRIVQHKTPSTDRPAKDAEDCTGLSNPPTIPNAVTVSGAVTKGHADYTPEAAQVAHAPKPPNPVNIKPHMNIQQPRK